MFLVENMKDPLDIHKANTAEQAFVIAKSMCRRTDVIIKGLDGESVIFRQSTLIDGLILSRNVWMSGPRPDLCPPWR